MIEFRRILCPTDFSESSIRSLAYAAALANWYEAELTVLRVAPTFDPVPLPCDLGQPIHVVNPVPREQVMEELGRTLDRTTLLAAPTLVAEAGDPPTTIVDRALSIGADLIVMGAQGRGGVDLALFGSSTQQVVRGAACPVLTVRSVRPS